MVRKLNSFIVLSAASAVLFALAQPADAVVVVNSSRNVAPSGGAVHAPHDPSTSGGPAQFQASAIDLAEGLTATVSYAGGTGSTMQELSTGESVWTDGSIATVYGQGGSGGDEIDHAAYGTVNGTVGGTDIDTLVTFDLLGSFDLARIDVFMGWNDSGRDDSSFNVSVSSDNVSYTQIASYNKGGDNTGAFTTPVTNRHRIDDDAAGKIALGVQYVQFQFTDADNGFAGVVEFDIFDTIDLPGDADKDGDVDINDFFLISDNFFSTPSAIGLDGDVTEDNFIDAADFRLWKDSASPAVIAQFEALSAPEPAAAGLLLAAGLPLLTRRRRLA